VPERLAELIGQCLEKDPARRPKSTTEVVRRLEEPAAVSGAFAMTSVVRRRSRRSLVLRALGVVALTGVIGVTALYPSRPDEATALVPSTPRAPVAPVPARTLFIGPLTVIGDAPEIRSLVQGLTSELATALVVVPGLRIGAQPAAPAATSTSAAPATPAAAVPAPTLRLEGTVQHERGQVRLLLRALDTTGDSTLWSGAFDGRADSLLVFQSRVARSVASALVITLSRPTPGTP
jgi:TolB-like protein